LNKVKAFFLQAICAVVGEMCEILPKKHVFLERCASGTAFAKWNIASNVARPSQPGFFVTQTFARRHWNGRPGVEPDALRRDSGKAPPPTRSAVSEPSTLTSAAPKGDAPLFARHDCFLALGS
jgi:hypothetical protein